MKQPTNTPQSNSDSTVGKLVNYKQNNTQPIEKRRLSDGKFLDVVDIFYTIQGEGPFTGKPAVFIRLAGCNLQCPACDTDYTSMRRTLDLNELYWKVVDLRGNDSAIVVITGGEPFRQNIAPLANMLAKEGYTVQIESNGTLAPSEGLSDDVVIVCSPKAGSINKKMMERANCFKYVLDHNSVDVEDGLPIRALDHSNGGRVARPPQGDQRTIYLQPMDTQDEKQNRLNIKRVVKSSMAHGYTLQLQIHKILGVE